MSIQLGDVVRIARTKTEWLCCGVPQHATLYYYFRSKRGASRRVHETDLAEHTTYVRHVESSAQFEMEEFEAALSSPPASDPLDCLTRAGWRLIWALDLDRSVIVIDEERIVLADVELSHSAVASAVIDQEATP